jgi:hypothetical protein
LFDAGEKKWGQINPWDLWENGTCSNSQEWNKNTKEIISFFVTNSINQIYVLGLGHSASFAEKMSLEEFTGFINKKCVTAHDLYWLEGLILTDNENIAFVSNHDGDIMLFNKRNLENEKERD